MYCGQCGKRVLDDMLFCPFCGSPIVIPDQDEPAPKPPRTAEPAASSGAEPETSQVVELEDSQVDEPELSLEAEQESSQDAGAEEESLEDAEPASEAAEALPPEEEHGEEEPGKDEAPFAPLSFEERPGEEPPEDGADEPPRRPASLFDDWTGTDEPAGGAEDGGADAPFAPLEIGEAIDIAGDEPEEAEPLPEEPPRQSARRRRAPLGGGRSVTQTFIPVRDVDPNDMFMDSAHPARDDYDPYDDEGSPPRSSFDDDFSFEEPESFVQRHIRGVVGLLLLLMLLVIFLIWAAMPNGQRVLASANLAWSAGVYNDMGYDAYEAGRYREAAGYFERALARDGDNYEYAHSAMVSYYEAGETSSALSMLKRCIDMEPDNPEPYLELTVLYPDAASRPWDVQQLLRQGYERTGEASLNAVGD